LLLQVAPRHIILFRADQREYIRLAPIFAHQRGGEAQAAAGLNFVNSNINPERNKPSYLAS
jgi:hypothetical protein